MSETEEILEKPHSKSKIEQQALRHCFPQHKPLSVLLTLLCFVIVTVPLGVATIVSSSRIVELEVRYDDVNEYKYPTDAVNGTRGALNFTFDNNSYSVGAETVVKFTLEKSLAQPIFLMYHLRGFFQNYRTYSTSMLSSQLMGNSISVSDNCKPFRYPGEYQDKDNHLQAYYSPCGGVAWSMFNDTISLYTSKDELICDGGQFAADGTNLLEGNKCRKKGIALSNEVKKSFRPPKPYGNDPMWTGEGDPSAENPYQREGFYYNEPGHRIPITTDEDFMIWVRAGYLPSFPKMYRVIETDLPAGEYYFKILEQYDTVSFSGKKYASLATRSWIGGKNYVLGSLLIVIGGLGFVLCVAIVFLRLIVRERSSHVMR